MVGKAVIKDNQKIAYIAPTYQQARDIAWEGFKKILTIDSSAHPQYNESRLEMVISNGSKIQLKGWESIETLRGQAFDFIVIDEIAMMRNFWLYWQEVIRPTLTDTKGEVMFISTPKGFNHFYDLYNLERTDHDFKSFHFTSYDNPFLPKEEIDKAGLEITPDRFAQEYMADFRKTEGLVYKEFERGLHLFSELPKVRFDKTILGIDFGYTNPTAMLLIKVDYDGTYWIKEEYYHTKQLTSHLINKINTYNANEIYADPEAPEKIEEFKQAGFNMMEVVKGKDSVINGIARVRDMLRQGKIKIHQSCINLIYEFETYHYPDKKPDNNEKEVPVKENDHALDALRYVISADVVHETTPYISDSNITYKRK